jgi:hypothetical protein
MTKLTTIVTGLVLAAIAILGAMTLVHNREQPAEVDRRVGKQIVDSISAEKHLLSREQVFFEASRRSVNINVYDVAKPDHQKLVVDQIRSLSVVAQYNGTVVVNFFPARQIIKKVLPSGVTESEVVPSRPLIIVTVK